MRLVKFLPLFVFLLLPILIFPIELTVRAEMENLNITSLGGGIRSFNSFLGVDLSVLKDLTNGFYMKGSLFLAIPAGDLIPYGGLTKEFNLSNLSNIFDFSTDLYGTIGLEIKMSNLGLFGEASYNLNSPITVINPSKISFGISFEF
ncbi:MAG TPA: hypothetical protein ENF81_09185 [Thermotogaceae bacterium]|nr:hypothetical protein [Thermotogota bacterium]HEW92698.1 hypothetical protein [Thermotogaceae bacterium]